MFTVKQMCREEVIKIDNEKLELLIDNLENYINNLIKDGLNEKNALYVAENTKALAMLLTAKAQRKDKR